jgi:integrase/recombinase XerC
VRKVAKSVQALVPVSHEDRVGQIVYNWLRSKVASTRINYEHDLVPFVRFMGEVSVPKAFAKLLSIAESDPVGAVGLCIAYHTSVHELLRSAENEGGLAPATINRRLTALRSMIAAFRDAGITTISPPLKGLRSKAYRDTRGIGKLAFDRIIAHLELAGNGSGPTNDPRALRDLAMFRLLFNRALRRAEVVGLDMVHVDLAGRRLSVLQKKYLERHWISIGQLEIAALERWIVVRSDSPGPLFQSLHHGHTGERLELSSVNRIVKERGEEAGVLGARPHGLRHSAITSALES